MKKIVLSLFLTNSLLLALPSKPYLPHNLALEIAKVTQNHCKKKGYNVSVSVVDDKGVILSMLRNENAGVHTAKASFKKAFTAVSMKNNTSVIAQAILSDKAPKELSQLNENFVFLGGGVVIKSNSHIIGAVGVGGAPLGEVDEDCAKAGIASIQKFLD